MNDADLYIDLFKKLGMSEEDIATFTDPNKPNGWKEFEEFMSHEYVALLNCLDEKVLFDIGKLDDILSVSIRVLSGDEVMSVRYKDGTVRTFDSDRHYRMIDFPDGEYDVYFDGKTNLLHDSRWLNRKKSDEWPYDMEKATEGVRD